MQTEGRVPNTVVYADNLDYLRTMPDGVVDLIYIDPPFNTGKTQSRESIRTVRDEESGDRVGFQGRRYRTERVGSSAFGDQFDDYLGVPGATTSRSESRPQAQRLILLARGLSGGSLLQGAA